MRGTASSLTLSNRLSAAICRRYVQGIRSTPACTAKVGSPWQCGKAGDSTAVHIDSGNDGSKARRTERRREESGFLRQDYKQSVCNFKPNIQAVIWYRISYFTLITKKANHYSAYFLWTPVIVCPFSKHQKLWKWGKNKLDITREIPPTKDPLWPVNARNSLSTGSQTKDTWGQEKQEAFSSSIWFN